MTAINTNKTVPDLALGRDLARFHGTDLDRHIVLDHPHHTTETGEN